MKYIILIGAIFFVACKSNETKTTLQSKVHLLYIDTSRYAILQYDPKKYGSFFDKTCKAASLTADDIDQIEKIIADTVKKYNKGSTSVYSFINRPDQYYKQFITVTNQKGEKEVWVNCFCNYDLHDKSGWRNGLITAMDGGSCYFELKVNIAKNTLEEFYVNGPA